MGALLAATRRERPPAFRVLTYINTYGVMYTYNRRYIINAPAAASEKMTVSFVT